MPGKKHANFNFRQNRTKVLLFIHRTILDFFTILTLREQAVNIDVSVDMGKSKTDFVEIHTVQGELTAHAIKSHLESEGIPVLLQYESVGAVYGLTVNGLGEVKILVPQDFLEEAKQIIKPQE